MKTKILILAAVLALAACGGVKQKKAAPEPQAAASDMHTAETSLDYEGIYTGIFPAADCPGINITLTLKHDGTYNEHYKYLERNSEFTEQGGYLVKDNTLTLTPQDGDGISYYKVEEGRLRRLDADKQSITGPLAEHYILKKSQSK